MSDIHELREIIVEATRETGATWGIYERPVAGALRFDVSTDYRRAIGGGFRRPVAVKVADIAECRTRDELHTYAEQQIEISGEFAVNKSRQKEWERWKRAVWGTFGTLDSVNGFRDNRRTITCRIRRKDDTGRTPYDREYRKISISYKALRACKSDAEVLALVETEWAILSVMGGETVK